MIGAIIVIIVGGFLFLLVLGFIGFALKALVKFSPFLIIGGILVWAMFAYPSQFFWVAGVSLVLLLCAGAYHNHSQVRIIKNECLPLLKTKNTTALLEKFLEYNSHQKKIFLETFSGTFSTYSIYEERLMNELFLSDFIEFAKNNSKEKSDSMIFEKKDGDAYLRKAWKQQGKDVDAAKTLLQLSKKFSIQEQNIFNKDKESIALIIIKKKTNTDLNLSIDFSGAIDLD